MTGCDRTRPGAAAALVALACIAAPSCESRERVEPTDGAARASDGLRFVHVRWPGRPASDAFDHRVLADPRIERATARLGLVVTTVDQAPPAAREALGGAGTLAFDAAGDVIAVRRGVRGSAAGFEAWLESVARDAPRLVAADRAHGPAAERARLALRLGLVDRARELVAPPAAGGDTEACRVLAEVELACGDVAAARAAFDAAGAATGADERRLDARILLAERRADRALDRLAALPDEPATLFLRAEALAARGATAAAHALFGIVAETATDATLAARARERFTTGVFEPHVHGDR